MHVHKFVHGNDFNKNYNFFFYFKRHSFPARATPLNPLIHPHRSTVAAVWLNIRCSSDGFGGFASQWLQAPNQSNLGEKAGPRPAGKKIHFSSEIARCSTRARLPKGTKTFRNFSFIFSTHMFFSTFSFSETSRIRSCLYIGPRASVCK